jgi:hypothetical protein
VFQMAWKRKMRRKEEEENDGRTLLFLLIQDL